MESRPRIGISADVGAAGQVRLGGAYVEAVTWAGGVPLVVPAIVDRALVEELVQAFDGLVLSGGDGLPGSLHGPAGRLPEDLEPVSALRLESELALYRAARRARKPVLGICLGMQLMGLEAGGSLFMDVQRDRPGTLAHSPKRGRPRHRITPVPGSALERWSSEAPAQADSELTSSHLQALERVGSGFVVAAVADDGVIEAIEPASGFADSWLLGVQWHAERDLGPLGRGLLRRLVEAAEASSRPRTRRHTPERRFVT
jgi:putative glutamine amidotransferase